MEDHVLESTGKAKPYFAWPAKICDMTSAKQKSASNKTSILLVSQAEVDIAADEYMLRETMDAEGLNNPLDDILVTAEAVFTFIRNSEMDLELKSAFYQLEKQFEQQCRKLAPQRCPMDDASERN